MPSLRSVKLVRELEDSFATLREQRRDFRIVQYSLQGDHAHFIVEAKDRRSLGHGMKALSARLARAVNRVFRRSGAVLKDRYHLHLLKTPREVRSAIAYVLLNARHHARRPSRGDALDPASSGRWFDGWKRQPVIPATALRHGRRSSPVAVARTWLARVGWRRHGLVDPAEIPGREAQRSTRRS